MPLQIDDVFYKVNKQHTGIPRKKDHMFVDGRHWYAYEKPVYDVSISMIRIIGVLEKHLKGEWLGDSPYDLITEYYVKEISVDKETTFITDSEYLLKDNMVFKSIDEALAKAEELRKEVEELDSR